MSSLNSVISSDAAQTILVIAACYDALAHDAERCLAEHQSMRWTEFDSMMILDRRHALQMIEVGPDLLLDRHEQCKVRECHIAYRSNGPRRR
jgi:hypothetical protein